MGKTQDEDNDRSLHPVAHRTTYILAVSRSENELEGIACHPDGDRLIVEMLNKTTTPEATIESAHRALRSDK